MCLRYFGDTPYIILGMVGDRRGGMPNTDLCTRGSSIRRYSIKRRGRAQTALPVWICDDVNVKCVSRRSLAAIIMSVACFVRIKVDIQV